MIFLTQRIRLIMQWALAVLLVMFGTTNSSADEYHLGEGYTTGNINIAGYINLVAEAPRDGKAQAVGDDMSLFVSAHFNKYLNPFFEAEYSGATLWREGGGLFSDFKPTFVLERLYNDSNLTENLSLRLGKLLTPVGEWNTIHAAPLVWTTTRPMTTTRSFANYTSGLELNYLPENSRLPEIQLYLQPDGEIMPRRDELRGFIHVAGAHLNWEKGLNDKIGLSLQHADVNRSDDTQTLLGFNARKTLDKFEIETEATYTWIQGAKLKRVRDDEWGAYLQGGYALSEKWSLVARQEYFSDRNTTQTSRNSLLGMVWRPVPAIAWKLEYVKQDGARLSISSGVYASFSVLF